jgi:hypothetical protein
MQAVRIILDRGLVRGAPARLYTGTVIVITSFPLSIFTYLLRHSPLHWAVSLLITLGSSKHFVMRITQVIRGDDRFMPQAAHTG